MFGYIPVVGAEIGVYLAENSYSILKTLNIKQLYLIDPFVVYEPYNYYEENYTISKNRLKDFSDRTVFIKKFSDEAINDIPMLDFCYIDGNHTYDFIKHDIELYWDKVKPGGIIGGHDIFTGGWKDFDVVKAVSEFVVYNNLASDLCIESPDWFIIKRK